jgi:Tol biopolymer transport system component
MQSRTSLVALVAAVFVLAIPLSADAAFPGYNGKIAFLSSRGCPSQSCPGQDLYTINPDGSFETKLLSEFTRDPAWSPDGRKIAFRADSPFGFYIAVVNADGGGRTVIAPPRPPFSSDVQPAWSPDGKKLAVAHFALEPFLLYDIFVMDADGTDATRLTYGDPYAGTLGSTEPA